MIMDVFSPVVVNVICGMHLLRHSGEGNRESGREGQNTGVLLRMVVVPARVLRVVEIVLERHFIGKDGSARRTFFRNTTI